MKRILTIAVVTVWILIMGIIDSQARGGFRPDAVQSGRSAGIGGASGGIAGNRAPRGGASSRADDIRSETRRGTATEQADISRREQREAADRTRTQGDYRTTPPATWIGTEPVAWSGAAPVVSYTIGGGNDPQDPLNPNDYGDGYFSHGGYYAGGYRGGYVGGNRNHLGSFPD
ncbi:MAG: hypothetical protein KC931_00830 [Candidatus Omnitrophica bacterium]|nr:hypothetical protein [Candidatus Omnitrophota bacterium]